MFMLTGSKKYNIFVKHIFPHYINRSGSNYYTNVSAVHIIVCAYNSKEAAAMALGNNPRRRRGLRRVSSFWATGGYASTGTNIFQIVR